MLRPFDRVAGSMFLTEIRDLLDSTLFRIQQMEAARDAWIEHEAIATRHATADPDDYSQEAFSEALRATSFQNRELFDVLESFFAAWARLSLLFYPVRTKGETGAWRKERGKRLRACFDLSEESLLSNRDFRDSWMHFDERMDEAWLNGWLGNRQQFVHSADVPSAIKRSVRVIDVESLRFHYRTESGDVAAVSLAELKAFLLGLVDALPKAGRCVMETLPAPA